MWAFKRTVAKVKDTRFKGPSKATLRMHMEKKSKNIDLLFIKITLNFDDFL